MKPETRLEMLELLNEESYQAPTKKRTAIAIYKMAMDDHKDSRQE